MPVFARGREENRQTLDELHRIQIQGEKRASLVVRPGQGVGDGIGLLQGKTALGCWAAGRGT